MIIKNDGKIKELKKIKLSLQHEHRFILINNKE